MRYASLLTPISLLASGGVLLLLFLLGPQTASNAAPNGQTEPYPGATSVSSYPGPSAVASVTTTQTSAAVTPQTTAPAISPATTPTARSTAVPNPTAFSTPIASTAVRTATTVASRAVTPSPTVDDSTRTCVPGETVLITGSGPANAGFLVLFNQRVVSGGTVRGNGTYSIGLTVGNERQGSYPVEVRVRGSRQLLTTFTCQVPDTTPTPVGR